MLDLMDQGDQKVPPENQDIQVKMDRWDLRERRVIPEPKDHMDQKESKVQKENQDTQEKMEAKEKLEILDQWDIWDHKNPIIM